MVLLGLFFQINRMDILLYLSPWQNVAVQSLGKTAHISQHEKFLIIYDDNDVQSVLTRHIAEKLLREQKKFYSSIPDYVEAEPGEEYAGVIICTNKLNTINGLSNIEAFVENGGTAVVLRNLDASLVSPELMAKMGVADIGQEVSSTSVRVTGDMLLGLEGYEFQSDSYGSSTTEVSLLPDAAEELSTMEGFPLVWQHGSGQGKYIVCNTRERDDKNNYGIYTAIFSQIHEDYIYPILNIKLFYIDDFPSPVPEGNFERLYQETGMSTADFYRKLWWPEMMANADKYDLKYTGLVIESYGNQVQGPFAPLSNGEARNNLIVYGRELLKAGGELGIHGYNHQSLAPAGYGQERLGYVPWPSQADMEEGLRELKRYIEEVYPGYVIQTYVPPSNILSKEGHAAVKNAFPDIKVYGSLFSGLADAIEYFQEFQINPDGTYDLPRVSSGYTPSSDMVWEAYTVINYNGAFSHFVHPDEIFYKESGDLTWAKMKQGMEDFVGSIHERFWWLEPVTASEAAEKLQDLTDMDYHVDRTAEGISMELWDFKQPVTFVLRTHKTIDSVTGGKAERIQDNAYILTVEKPEFEIKWVKQ